MKLDDVVAGNFNTPVAAVEYLRSVFQVTGDQGPAATIGRDLSAQLTRDIQQKRGDLPEETSSGRGAAGDSVTLRDGTTVSGLSAVGALAITALAKAMDDGTLDKTVRQTLDNFVQEAKKSGKDEPLANAVAAAQSDPSVYNALVGDLTKAIFKNAKEDITQNFSVTGRMAGLGGATNKPGAFAVGKRSNDRSGLRALLPNGADRAPASGPEQAGASLPGGVTWAIVAAILAAFVLYCVYVIGFSGRTREAKASSPPPNDSNGAH